MFQCSCDVIKPSKYNPFVYGQQAMIDEREKPKRRTGSKPKRRTSTAQPKRRTGAGKHTQQKTKTATAQPKRKTGAGKQPQPKRRTATAQPKKKTGAVVEYEILGGRENWGKFVRIVNGKPKTTQGSRTDVVLSHTPGFPVREMKWDWTDFDFHHKPDGYNNEDVQSYALHWANSFMGWKQVHIIFALGYDKVIARAKKITGANPSQLRYYKQNKITVHQLETSAAAKKFNELVLTDEPVMMFFHTTC